MRNPSAEQIASRARKEQRKWADPRARMVDDPPRELGVKCVEEWAREAGNLNRQYYRFLASLRIVFRMWSFLTGISIDPDEDKRDSTWISEALDVDEAWLQEMIAKRVTPDLQRLLMRPESASRALLALESIHDSVLMLEDALAPERNHDGSEGK